MRSSSSDTRARQEAASPTWLAANLGVHRSTPHQWVRRGNVELAEGLGYQAVLIDLPSVRRYVAVRVAAGNWGGPWPAFIWPTETAFVDECIGEGLKAGFARREIDDHIRALVTRTRKLHPQHAGGTP